MDSDMELELAVYHFTSAANRCLDAIAFAIQKQHVCLSDGEMVLTPDEADHVYRNLHKLLRPHEEMDMEAAAEFYVDQWKGWRDWAERVVYQSIHFGVQMFSWTKMHQDTIDHYQALLDVREQEMAQLRQEIRQMRERWANNE